MSATWGVIDGLLSDLGAGTSWEAPSQYADTHARAKPFSAERRLFLAAFQAAIDDCHEPEGGWRAASRRRWHDQALEWVRDDSGTILSFVWYCDSLGFDSQAIRAAVLNGRPISMPRSEPQTDGPHPSISQEMKRRERQRRWYVKHRQEKLDYDREYARRWRAAHRQEIREYNRLWMKKHRNGDFA